MQDLCKQFRQGMRITRQKKGISLEKFSKMTNINISYLSHLENGKVCPSVKMVARICEALGVSGNELFENGDF